MQLFLYEALWYFLLIFYGTVHIFIALFYTGVGYMLHYSSACMSAEHSTIDVCKFEGLIKTSLSKPLNRVSVL